jgi:WD40 repeat protein
MNSRAISVSDQPVATIPPELLDSIGTGECVLFAGAGLSARAGLQIWDQFLASLLEFGRSKQVLTPDYAASLEAALREGDRNSAADGLVTSFTDRKMLQDFLRHSFPEHIPLPRAHGWLSQIAFSTIVTSNYDTLLERAFPHFSESGLFTPKDAEPLLDALSQKRQFILKLYGIIERPETLIFAPLEYREMVSSNVSFAKFFEGLFFSRSFLFLGLSLEGIQDFLSGFVFRGVSPRRHFALVAVTGSGWKAKTDLLQRRYNIRVIDYPLTPGFEGFDTFVEALSLAARPVVVPEGSTAAAATAPKTGLRKVILEDIGSFERLELDFAKETNWMVLLGDNGVGKSTVLKAIAAGIIGSDSKSYAGRLVRAGKTKGRVTLITEQNPHGYVTEILTKDMVSEADVVSLPSRYLEAEGCLTLGFSPLRVVTWNPSAGPQTIVLKGRPTADDLVPLLAGESDPRMDRLKQWIVNLDAVDKPRETRAVSGHRDRVTSLAFRADGRILLSGSIDGTVREWDTWTGQELRKIDAHSSGVNAVAYTANGTTILSGSYDRTLKSWSTDAGRYLTTFRGNQSQVLAVAASADGKTFVSGSEGGSIRVWNLASGSPIRRIDTRNPVWSLAVSEDGATVAAACNDGTVKVYEIGGSLQRSITVQGGGAWALAVSENGKLLAGSEQGVVGVWELHSGAPVQTLGTPSGGVLSVAITADGRTAAAGAENGMLRIWEVSTGRELLAVKAHSEGVWAVAFSPDGRTLATGSGDKSIKVWNVPELALPQYATIREFFGLIAKLTDRTDIEFLQVTENFRVMVKVAEAVQGVPLEVLSQGLTSLIGWVGVLCQRLKETIQNAVDTPLVLCCTNN